jgi:class 3 adenylate cyclase
MSSSHHSWFRSDSGFTNWSSSRQPVQVFELLETLYGAFDELADRRKVFKIETIVRYREKVSPVTADGSDGDNSHDAVVLFHLFFSRVTATSLSPVSEPEKVLIQRSLVYANSPMLALGLPDPQKRHAIIMVRFAADCRAAMNSITTELESKLGPGTSDLALRIGLHSGAVTAGVLRYVSR